MTKQLRSLENEEEVRMVTICGPGENLLKDHQGGGEPTFHKSDQETEEEATLYAVLKRADKS